MPGSKFCNRGPPNKGNTIKSIRIHTRSPRRLFAERSDKAGEHQRYGWTGQTLGLGCSLDTVKAPQPVPQHSKPKLKVQPQPEFSISHV